MLEGLKIVLREAFPELELDLSVDERKTVTICGEANEWNQVVDIGHLIAKQSGVRNVVNELGVKGKVLPRKDYAPYRQKGEALGEAGKVDVLIVGAGISGCGIARELSKYKLDILVAEMNEDVATGATSANNGHIHPGHAVKPHTLKAKLNVQGNRMYTKWAEELGFDLQRCGSYRAVENLEDMPQLEQIYSVAKLNGVDGVEMLDGKTAMEREPGFARNGLKPLAAVSLPSYGIIEPYQAAVALAENAAENGVRFWFNCTVAAIFSENGKVTGAVTNKGIVKAKYIINCAGVYADEISAMAGDKSYTIHPRKGAIAILDKATRPMFGSLSSVSGRTTSVNKNPESKGGGMCRTPEGNILMGPSAEETYDKDDVSVTPEGLAYSMGRGLGDYVKYSDVIRFFAGTRPADYMEDFIIEQSPVTSGFINCGAIQSPGLASAPAIAEMVEGILAEEAGRRGEALQKNDGFNPIRRRKAEFRYLSREEQDALIAKDPRYGRIVCRCESITEGEIIDAMRSPIVPASIDAVKRRTRAGMGRCQGGFCQVRVLEILARELGKDLTDITLKGEGTNVLVRDNRPGAAETVLGRSAL